MFYNKIRYVAGFLAATVLLTSMPADVFTATEENKYMFGTSVAFTAGAHLAMEESIVGGRLKNLYPKGLRI